ncbi:hypothetical protein SADUNF_Sadunf05G0133500 [Salix dunnii]|uniref:Uncharacterized protein n=1 Tax=Salix dunnii TaxID=1413687 RepID=A0A835KB59_9ROSI|nr:hypothetical protein SADUNF_Sadunf05G0133500 [Salix dunnii]
MEVKNSPGSGEAIKSKTDPCFKHKNGSLFPKKRRLVKTMMFYSIASAISGFSRLPSSKTQAQSRGTVLFDGLRYASLASRSRRDSYLPTFHRNPLFSHLNEKSEWIDQLKMEKTKDHVEKERLRTFDLNNPNIRTEGILNLERAFKSFQSSPHSYMNNESTKSRPITLITIHKNPATGKQAAINKIKRVMQRKLYLPRMKGREWEVRKEMEGFEMGPKGSHEFKENGFANIIKG